jgi:hypothetical protein
VLVIKIGYLNYQRERETELKRGEYYPGLNKFYLKFHYSVRESFGCINPIKYDIILFSMNEHKSYSDHSNSTIKQKSLESLQLK